MGSLLLAAGESSRHIPCAPDSLTATVLQEKGANGTVSQTLA